MNLKHTLPLLIPFLFATGLFAAPTGGPYGPRAMAYEIPEDANIVYYVAPNGSPSSAGESISSPTTFEAAISRVVTGDVIVMLGGVYRTGSLLLNQGVIIQPHQDEQVVLKGTRVADKWERLDNGLWRTEWEQLFPMPPANWWRRHRHGHNTPLHWFNNDMVFINGQLLDSAGWEGEVDAGSYYIDYDSGHVYIGRDPSGQSVEITAHDSAIVRVTGEVHGKSSDGLGPVIRGITFTQYAYRALEVDGTEPEGPADPATYGKDVVGTVLENVTFTYCSRVAAYLRGDNLKVINCLVSDTETEGIYIIASSDCLLEGNIFQRNNMQNMQGYYPSAVKIFNQTHRVVCRNNLVRENPHSEGIWYDVGNRDGLFVDNWVEDCINGFFFEISRGAVAAGNVFVNCGSGTFVLNSADVELYHNTYINCTANFMRNTRSAVGDHFGWHPATGPDVDERHGHVFRNNLLVADANYNGPMLLVHQDPALDGVLTDSPLRDLDDNVYVKARPEGEGPFINWGPVEAEPYRMEAASLEMFRETGLGLAQHSVDFIGYQDQVFKSSHLKNYHLLPEFPARLAAGPLDPAVLEKIGLKQDLGYPGAFPVVD